MIIIKTMLCSSQKHQESGKVGVRASKNTGYCGQNK